jgi:SAM-dependent methyltransferase
VAFHDAECGSYTADLPVWEELAERAGGPVLELGCGTGRVALRLAELGHEVVASDSDAELLEALRSRGGVETALADARTLDLGRRFALIVAPMQVVQLMGGADGRRSLLARARSHLQPGGLLAVALADPFAELPAEEALLPLPDVLERDGWVFSSQPLSVARENGAVVIERLRQSVSPAGELDETVAAIRLDSVSPEELEAEAEGYRRLERRRVEETAEHVGSTIVVLEAA